MKTFWLAVTILTLAMPSRAQLFGPDSLGGAVLGGLVGGVIGHNSGRRTAEGAAIGAGVGAVLGAISGNQRRVNDGWGEPAPVGAQRPNYALGGAVLGGIAGGVIGHNNGRQTAEGIAIGAGAGLLLGTLAEQSARRAEAAATPVMVMSPTPVSAVASTVEVAPETPSVPAPENMILRSYPGAPSGSSSMASANGLFGR
jgi:uncharacterized protein YcfJ